MTKIIDIKDPKKQLYRLLDSYKVDLEYMVEILELIYKKLLES